MFWESLQAYLSCFLFIPISGNIISRIWKVPKKKSDRCGNGNKGEFYNVEETTWVRGYTRSLIEIQIYKTFPIT